MRIKRNIRVLQNRRKEGAHKTRLRSEESHLQYEGTIYCHISRLIKLLATDLDFKIAMQGNALEEGDFRAADYSNERMSAIEETAEEIYTHIYAFSYFYAFDLYARLALLYADTMDYNPIFQKRNCEITRLEYIAFLKQLQREGIQSYINRAIKLIMNSRKG